MYWQARQPDSLAASSGSRKRNFIIPFFYRILRSERKERRRSEWFRWKAPSVWELAMTRVICLYIGLTATFESYKPASQPFLDCSLSDTFVSFADVGRLRTIFPLKYSAFNRAFSHNIFIHSFSQLHCVPAWLQSAHLALFFASF